MGHKKQKKKVYRKHYPNRFVQLSKKKKNGRKPLYIKRPYYFATKSSSFVAPIQTSVLLTPTLIPTSIILASTSLTPTSLQSLSPASTQTPVTPVPNYIYTPTVNSDYISTPVSDYAYTPTYTFIPASSPTATPEIADSELLGELSDGDTIPEDTSQSDEDQENEIVITVDENNEDTPTISAAAVISKGSNNAQNGTLASPNQTMQIAGPILGIVGVMAMVAATMFLVVRIRRKRYISHNNNKEEGEEENNDESRYFEITKNTPSPLPPIMLPRENLKNQEDSEHTNDENRFSHGTGTLVGSGITSRTSSTIKEKQKYMSISSWYSAASSLLETPSPPSSEVMLAERQQLHHERPSLLDHWKKPALIETYRAQLADLSDITDTI